MLFDIITRATRKGKRILKTRVGYDDRNWLRVRQIDAFEAFLKTDGRNVLPVLEVSPGWNKHWKTHCSDYTFVDYPDFDICSDRLSKQFHTVIADQVLEHVRHPVAAMQNIFSMVASGGWAMVATPFLFRIHARPHDYSRWTEDGLRQLLVDGGFDDEQIKTYSWGNKACARAHIGGPVKDFGLGKDLSNDPEYPVMVWAFAKKS